MPTQAQALQQKNMKCRIFLVIFLVLLIFSIGLCANLGEAKISFLGVSKIILGKILFQPQLYQEFSQGMVAIVWDIRLPRILCGVFVGMGLAVSGAVFQSLLMNALADPYTLGISTGAALGASIAIFISGILQIASIPVLPAAFAGAILTLILVSSIANRGNGLSSNNLIIAGIIVGSIMSAGISFLKNAAGEEVGAIVFWLMGSLASRTWEHVLVIIPVVMICSGICYYYASELNLLCTGEDNAKALGVDVRKVRWILLISASLITAACVSVSGIIGFIGLVVPHLLRFGFTSNNKNLLPMSAVLGALMLMLADNLSRAIFTSEIPVGVLTTLLGGPFFIYLFMKKTKRGGSAL